MRSAAPFRTSRYAPRRRQEREQWMTTCAWYPTGPMDLVQAKDPQGQRRRGVGARSAREAVQPQAGRFVNVPLGVILKKVPLPAPLGAVIFQLAWLPA